MSAHTPPPSPASPSDTPDGWAPLLRVVAAARGPVERFLKIEAASGIVLLVAAALALAAANSPLAASYAALWDTPLNLGLGPFGFSRPIAWWVNDGLMALFFFVVGLEIRREIYDGELSELRRAALPAIAALGGMLAPAALYLAVAGAPETHSGWGVPMATDIAFAVGVLALLGRRAPPALRVLLLALAVIDDLGAILVIALFYTGGIDPTGLLVALAGLGVIVAMQAGGASAPVHYILPSLVVWAGTYASGVHPTIAGVILGLLTPVHRNGRALSGELIHGLHPWVAFGIMPLFAFANAGVALAGLSLEGAGARVGLGVALGLVVGKPLGVFVACALAQRLGIATLPSGLGRRHLLVLGVVAGIGFTMALFIAQLAFTDAALLGAAKLGVLVSSGAAGVIALALGVALLPSADASGARSETEAERSTDL